MNKTIVNTETGEVIERPFTDDELAQMEIDDANAKALRKKIEKELSKKESERQTILARLGLTADELKTILG
jgi:hypothetical protein